VSITALPPNTTEPPEGVTEYYVCNVFEWAAATLKPGDACYFIKNNLPWKRGTFRMSWFYDGIIASVFEDDPDEYILHSLFLDTHMGDRLITPEDYVTIKQWETRQR
jgi:hypothetical protein